MISKRIQKLLKRKTNVNYYVRAFVNKIKNKQKHLQMNKKTQARNIN